ncbi:bifunctional hydroxymethylpyrimidine kinase/phosphomethylpyrimidine kinase, partial [Streptomyces sp. tea 10]|nr:bifunctional hydroxymethylpyrimidine kinase/phosphomethylpyrimidine kinase [Streptomyces sp. tea 10]
MDTTPSTAIPRVLSIAGTDPTGGAGHAADLKSIAALGGYGLSVITAVVAQNTRGVVSVHTPPVQVLRDQLDAVAGDVTLDAIKVGMLGSVEVIETGDEQLLDVDMVDLHDELHAGGDYADEAATQATRITT